MRERGLTESEPEDAGAVHGEADQPRLVEVFRDFARLERVDRACEDQEHVEQQRDEKVRRGRLTR